MTNKFGLRGVQERFRCPSCTGDVIWDHLFGRCVTCFQNNNGTIGELVYVGLNSFFGATALVGDRYKFLLLVTATLLLPLFQQELKLISLHGRLDGCGSPDNLAIPREAHIKFSLL